MPEYIKLIYIAILKYRSNISHIYLTFSADALTYEMPEYERKLIELISKYRVKQ